MRCSVITLFPEMFSSITDYGVTRKAVENKKLQLDLINLRDFANNKHNTVDDRPYGGGPGMLMMAEPLLKAVNSVKKKAKVIYLSPQGKVVNSKKIKQLAKEENLVFIAGRYEGIDERVIEEVVDEELSIGDYVLTGGELPTMVLIDAISRWIPGVLGHDESANEDSFENNLLDCPHYTRPEVVNGKEVPSVLLSGNHAEIEKWRLQQKVYRTWQRRPDLLQNLTEQELTLLDEVKKL